MSPLYENTECLPVLELLLAHCQIDDTWNCHQNLQAHCSHRQSLSVLWTKSSYRRR